MSPQVVLVTGSSGFIASHFVEFLANRHPDWRIIALDRLDYESNDTHSALPANATFVHSDICNGTRLLALLLEHNVTMIAHLAAQTSVDRSFHNVQGFLQDNVVGTQVILDAIRYAGRAIRLLHMSTDEVYGSITTVVDETAALLPTNPYAATKAAAEMMIHAHRKCHGLDVVIARCNNVFGPRQHAEKLIPRFIGLLRSGRKCTIHGQGTVCRRFLHVRDACEALYLLMTRGVSGEAYNIGALHAISIRDVTKLIIETALGSQVDWTRHVTFVPDRAFNDLDYNTCSAKLCALGWAPQITLAEGLVELCGDRK